MRVAAIQSDIVWKNPEANFARLTSLLKESKNQGTQLAVLPEMFSWGFCMDTLEIAEPENGPSAEFLKNSAEELDIWVCGTYPEASGQEPPAYNQFLLAGPDGQSHKYAKIHPFSYSGEDKHYKAGDKTLTLDIEGVSVSVFTCYDLRFGEDFWRLASETDLYIIPANWPAARRNHWKQLLAARAIENQAYVLGVNRVGEGDGIFYSGDSVIMDPLGEILAKSKSWDEGSAGNEETKSTEEVLVAEINPSFVKETRAKFPFLQDRRPEQ